jgi:methyl-accepting chemotaxis protein
MDFARRYSLTLFLPPFFTSVPVATLFLVHVRGLDATQAWRLGVPVFLGYAAGALFAAFRTARAARLADQAIANRRDPNAVLSRALEVTTFWATLLWVGWGGILGLAGAVTSRLSFLNVQYYGEAVLIVAAPAMAWAYWAGKGLLVSRARGVEHLEYRGRVWSVGVKIAIVFIGFFIVSTGALILMISSRVARQLGDEAAFEIGRLGLLMALVTACVFAMATWFLAHDIIRPLQEIVRLAGEMAEGRFRSDPRVFADDEFGKVARHFGVTRRNVQALVGHIGERGQSVLEGARSMESGTGNLIANVEDQEAMSARAAAALAQVQDEARVVVRHAETVAVRTSDSSSSAAELRASFAEVARRMDELSHSVEKSSSAATEIDASARETASRTADLSSIGSDVLAFVTQMEAAVGGIMQTARATSELSERVRSDAQEGRHAVDATVAGIRKVEASTSRTAEAFNALQKSLGQIDQILLFIDDVTNRTNLLSLNAAIIAAQAGTRDHGFSVIADEVRQLADRTRTATKEIAAILRAVRPVTQEALAAIGETSGDVDRSVQLARNAASSLTTILASAGQTLEMTRSISTAVEEQAAASAYLHRVTSRLSDNIAEMRRAAEGQAAATRMLAEEAERVSEIAIQVKQGTREQTAAADAIAGAVEDVAAGAHSTTERLEQQLRQTERIAELSRESRALAEQNRRIAEQFRSSLDRLLAAGEELEREVTKYRG